MEASENERLERLKGLAAELEAKRLDPRYLDREAVLDDLVRALIASAEDREEVQLVRQILAWLA